MVDRLAGAVASFVASALAMDAEDREVVAFGSKLLLLMMADAVVVLAVAALLGVVPAVAAAYITIVLLKSFAGGAHASRMGVCLLTGTALYAVLGIVARAGAGLGLTAARLALAGAAALSVFAFVRYAPAPPPNKPIKLAARRRALRRGSLLALGGVLGLGLVWAVRPFTQPQLFWGVCLALVWQSLILFPVTRRLYGRI